MGMQSNAEASEMLEGSNISGWGIYNLSLMGIFSRHSTSSVTTRAKTAERNRPGMPLFRTGGYHH